MKSDVNQQLISRLKRRDKTVISVLYDRYGDTLYGIILKVVAQNEALAQDVLQDSFVKIWKNGHRFDEQKGTLFTWMLNICRNQAIDRTRSAAFRHQVGKQAVDYHLTDNIKHSYSHNTEQIGLRSEVAKLEEKYREIIELIYFQGFTQKEVVDHLNIPLGTVKSRVRIGLRELKKLFGVAKLEKVIVLCILGEQLIRLL